MCLWKLNLPFLQALHALWADFLHGDDHPRAALRRAESLLVDPSLENLPEAPFSDEGVRPEILRRRPQLGVRENPEVGGLEDHPLGPRRLRP